MGELPALSPLPCRHPAPPCTQFCTGINCVTWPALLSRRIGPLSLQLLHICAVLALFPLPGMQGCEQTWCIFPHLLPVCVQAPGGQTHSPPSWKPGRDPAGPAGSWDTPPLAQPVLRRVGISPMLGELGAAVRRVGRLLHLLPWAGIWFFTAFLCSTSALGTANLGVCKAGV